MKRLACLFVAAQLAACGLGGGADRSRPPEQYLIASPNGEPLGLATERSQCERLLANWFIAADSTRDGHLSEAEMHADALRWFRRADTDGNDYITVEELTALRRGMAARPAEEAPRPQRADRDRPVVREPDPVMAADLNLDFRVSQEELLAMAGRRYAALGRRGPVDRTAVIADCERRNFR